MSQHFDARIQPVPIIGLVGGIASGKSKVAQLLESLGAVRIDADRIGHAILRSSAVRDQLVAAFGSSILDQAGEIQRSALSQLVFGSQSSCATNRKRLESIVHPQIQAEVLARISQLCDAYPAPTAIVLDAPLLIEAGWDQWCDQILFVDASNATRLKRSIQRGWSASQLQQRELAQAPLDQKKMRATYVIHNDTEVDSELARQVEAFWKSSIERA